MPTFPEKPSTTKSNGLSLTIKDPLISHSISTGSLLKEGWVAYGKNSYEKDKKIIVFDGVYWNLENIKFRFMEQLKEYLTNGKIPENE